jgi:hypothetical protein
MQLHLRTTVRVNNAIYEFTGVIGSYLQMMNQGFDLPEHDEDDSNLLDLWIGLEDENENLFAVNVANVEQTFHRRK